VQFAKNKYPKLNFKQADLTNCQGNKTFDLIFANSLLHHISDEYLGNILNLMCKLSHEKSEIHIIDLVLPNKKSIPYYLAKLDRGHYPREISEWSNCFSQYFDINN
jgi:trans-aconitate methyltransferase